jgi:hypothetical protein
MIPIHILAALMTEPSDITEILANHGIKKESVMAMLDEDLH